MLSGSPSETGREAVTTQTWRAAIHSVALSASCLVSYWVVTHLLTPVHLITKADVLLGGMWAVIATIFVYRLSYGASVAAAVSRVAATFVAFALCGVYLLLFSFHPLGLAVVIVVITLLLTLTGHPEQVATAGITAAVVLVAAALSPHDAWQQPILRLVDTVVGVAVGIGAAWIALRLAPAEVRVLEALTRDSK